MFCLGLKFFYFWNWVKCVFREPVVLPPRGGKNEERSGGNDLILLNTFNFDGVLQQVWAPGGYPGFKIRAQARLST